jgi:predicted glutamine amidotransferase
MTGALTQGLGATVASRDERKPVGGGLRFRFHGEGGVVRAFGCSFIPAGMCRWLGYFGDPLRIEELVYNTTHSLIEQSRAARFTTHLTNADGFGIGWYGTEELPGVYRSVSPAWSDRNLQELCAQIRSPLFLAHVRATTGTPVQQTNCHPFRHGRWLFVHNGFIDQYTRLRRDLLLAVDPQLFERIEGTTDSELMFFLAVTFGLDDEPLAALERMAGFVETTGRRHGVEDPLQMTLGVSDGERLYAVRYASGQMEANSLYVSNDARDVRLLYPENERLQHFADEARAVVSEPLANLPGVWREVLPATALIIQPGDDEQVPFGPRS